MKASVVTAYGGPEVMKYQDMQDPKPGAGDILVKVAGVGINPELDSGNVTRFWKRDWRAQQDGCAGGRVQRHYRHSYPNWSCQ